MHICVFTCVYTIFDENVNSNTFEQFKQYRNILKSEYQNKPSKT